MRRTVIALLLFALTGCSSVFDQRGVTVTYTQVQRCLELPTVARPDMLHMGDYVDAGTGIYVVYTIDTVTNDRRGAREFVLDPRNLWVPGDGAPNLVTSDGYVAETAVTSLTFPSGAGTATGPFAYVVTRYNAPGGRTRRQLLESPPLHRHRSLHYNGAPADQPVLTAATVPAAPLEFPTRCRFSFQLPRLH